MLGVLIGDAPRIEIALSPRLWLAFFGVTATAYLVHADASRVGHGRWPLFFPWFHTSALPVFAVLAVLMALAWRVVQRWLADYEQYVDDAVRRAAWLVRAPQASPCFPRVVAAIPPRRLFGRAFDCRPPPAPA